MNRNKNVFDKKIILIVDDSEINRALLSDMLSNEYEIIEAENGLEASAILHEHEQEISLMLLDIMMPVMDGYQSLVGIRNLEKERNIPEDQAVKVIMTTALNDEKNVKMAFELGCTIYSGKPIDQGRFEQALKKLNLI